MSLSISSILVQFCFPFIKFHPSGRTPHSENELIYKWCNSLHIGDGKGKLFINKTQYFDGLPEEVWNFHIGSYQVCHKWLKDRKSRKLSTKDIEHYHKIVVVLNETIKIMKQIDEVIEAHGGWPIK